MKNFFTSLLGAFVALIIFTVGGSVLLLGVFVALGAMAGKRDKAVHVEQGSYLVLDLSNRVTDAPPVVDLRLFGDEPTPTLQLRTITRSLRAAASDDRIAGLLIRGDQPELSAGSPGFGALKEIRHAIEEFKNSGKPVTAYLTYALTSDYYLASAADEIVLDPYGVILMPGLAAQPMFFAGALEKYGVGVQVARVGRYKSFVEPFTRTDMSDESRAQLQQLLDDVWEVVLTDVADSRGKSPLELQALVDSEGLVRPEAALKGGLVTRVAYRDEMIESLKKATRSEGEETFKQVSLADYSRVAKDAAEPALASKAAAVTSGRRGTIAIVYAEGDIVDGDSEQPGNVAGVRFARELRKLRQDDSVKAIVLRVNSPGGSVSASEAIQREVRLAREKKPVVVSMGTYAASGGYWISAYSNRIFAEPSTITGSIGVFGIQFDVQRLANNFGVTFDGVKTGKFADALTIARPKTEEEMAIFQRMVEWIYGEFIGKVAEGRQLDRAHVEEIAQGRVWSGVEAKALGLVDEIGGLDAAIAYAAQEAGLKSGYRLVEFPRKKEFAEAIAEMVEKMAPNNARATGVLGEVETQLRSELKVLNSFNDPQGIYARLPIQITIR